MFSGFVTRKRVVNSIGIHQKFNASAYRLIVPLLRNETFPSLVQIQHFEGINGPDGLKLKSPGENEPKHMYDPKRQTGEVLDHISNHYSHLVDALKEGDMVRAAFDASWLAHTITDGLTPAHQFPLDEELAKVREGSVAPEDFSWRHKGMVRTGDLSESLKKNWAIWGRKGLLSTHVNFEMGVAATLLLFQIKTALDWKKLNTAWTLGAVKFFQREAESVAKLDLYERFYKKGWTGEIASVVKNQLAPITAQTIATVWLLAYLDANLLQVTRGSAKRGRPVLIAET